MIRREAGFTLVELMITMVIFVFVIAAASQVFVGLITQFKQQSKIAETNIEGIVGLDIMRRDIENAGYGLPWVLPTAWATSPCTGYQEAVVVAETPWVDRDFNDGPPDNPARGTDSAGACNPPGAIRSGDGACTTPATCPAGSDVLVIKATNVAQNDASQKWTYVNTTSQVKEWDIPGETERLETSDRVIVISLGNTTPTLRTLVLNGGSFTATYVRNGTYLDASPDTLSAGFAPADTTDTRVVYGVAGAAGTALRMPFNRADFYVRTPTTANSMPTRCATGTGILYKGTVNHTDGGLTELPLLDCVADMQVYYRLDTINDGITAIDSELNSIAGLTAQNIREQVREIRVYILAHEGQRDRSYTFNNFTGACATCIRVGQSAVLGRDFNLATITDYLNYRWKVYTIVVQPKNLR
jgi:prepilin-type N-terminal cleavage/methylation domain-containing protein